MAIAYLGVGSNLGNRENNIKEAIRLLDTHGIELLQSSTLIQTDPVGGPAQQGLFLNGVFKIQTQYSPNKLLKILKQIEKDLGRTRTVRNGPRPIDLDILIYDNLTLTSKTLTIPHPRMTERDFVMTPLKEIAPELAERLLNANP